MTIFFPTKTDDKRRIPIALVHFDEGKASIHYEGGESDEFTNPEQFSERLRRLHKYYGFYSDCHLEDIGAWLRGHTVFGYGASNELTRLSCSEGKRTHWVIRKLKGRPLRKMEPDEALDVLIEVAEWLEEHGIRMTGRTLQTCGMRLWTNTLRQPVVISSPPEFGRNGLYGGRVQAFDTPRMLYDYAHMDIRSAYPAAMGSMRMPLMLVEHDDIIAKALEYPYGFAYAIVESPSWITPQNGILPYNDKWGFTDILHGERTGAGWWSYEELRIAADMGTKVYVQKAYTAIKRRAVFTNWLETISDTQGLSPMARKLVKGCANRLWGTFAFAQDRVRAQWANDGDYRTVTHKAANNPFQESCYLAALISAEVRIRIWKEAIQSHKPVHVDTDGVLVPIGTRINPNGDGPGLWGTRNHYQVIDLAGARAWKGVDQNGEIDYHVAGGDTYKKCEALLNLHKTLRPGERMVNRWDTPTTHAA